MENLKLNETPVRTAKNFKINNIKLENIRKNASLSEKIDRILSEDNIENQYVMCQAIIEYINVKFLTSRLGKTLPDYNILTIMIEYEKIDEELYDQILSINDRYHWLDSTHELDKQDIEYLLLKADYIYGYILKNYMQK